MGRKESKQTDLTIFIASKLWILQLNVFVHAF